MSGVAEMVGHMELTDRDHQILDFEGQWFKHAGAKEAQIRDRFDMSPTIYYQVLNALLDEPCAMADHPMTVRRLLRLRAARRDARTG